MVRLTGNRRYRVDTDGKIVLQVQTRRYFSTGRGLLPMPNEEPAWRDAIVEDLTEHVENALNFVPDCTRPNG